MQIPKSIKKVMTVMQENGFECYIVGGCVRDFLMGKEPHDFDITTNALPEETKKCFSDFRVIETGIQHGTVTVLIDGEPIEITTYRIDGEYEDNRHPKSVEFTSELKQDLSRRDFTVNALAYDGKNEICDLFSGREDLKNAVIRCVGNPDKRFNEDGLRILRALRFSSVLDFDIETETDKSIRRNKLLLKNISRERIFTELSKLVCGKRAKRVLIEFREVFEEIIPQLKEVEKYEKCTEALSRVEPSKELRFAALFAECDNTKSIFKSLKSDKNTAFRVSDLTADLKITLEVNKKELKKLLITRSFLYLHELVELKLAFGEAEEKCAEIHTLLREIETNKECVRISMLDINGNIIREKGLAEGKAIGEILKKLLLAVIEEKTENKCEKLIEYIKECGYESDSNL